MMNMSSENRKCYLVEDFDPGTDYSDGMTIALTPEACYSLKEAGVVYRIPEDLYDERALKKDDDKHFDEQLEWADEFDRIIKKNIAYCKEYGINLPRAHFMQLKYFVDSVIIHARIFQDVILSAKPDEVVYIYKEKDDEFGPNIYRLYNNKRRLFLKLNSLACKKHEIPISVKSIGTIAAKDISAGTDILKSIKCLLKRLNLKSVYYLFKYSKLSKLTGKYRSAPGLKLLVLHAGSLSMDIIIKKSIAHGDRVFVREGNRIVLISDVAQRDVLDLADSKPAFKESVYRDCVKAFDNILAERNIIDWISNRSNLDVSGLVAPYFKHFLEDICPGNIVETLLLREFYNREKIDFVVGRSCVEEDSISTFLAAADSKKRVCFQHGIMHDIKMAALTELGLSDHYFAMDGISEKLFKSYSQLDHISECRIFQSAHYLRAVSKMWRNTRGPKDTIMYVPTRAFAGYNAYNVNLYTLTRYFELQKAIIDHMGNMHDKNFIYKSTTVQEWSDDSLIVYINEKGYKNISVEKKLLMECLGMAEKIIFDYPGTGLYEVAACVIPAMSLCHETFSIDDEVRAFFGRLIQNFYSIPEAIQRIEYFMKSDPEDFIVDLPLSDDGPIEALQRIKNQEILLCHKLKR